MSVLKKYNKQIKFLITGGSSTLIDFIIYYLLSFKINISISKMVSMSCACVYSFFINKKWTFSFKGKTDRFLVTKYIVSQFLNILINTFTNTLVYNISGMKIVAFIIATGIAMTFNYLFQNYIVFKGEK